MPELFIADRMARPGVIVSGVRTLLLTIVLAPVVLAAQAGLPPLVLREAWHQRDRPANAPADFVPEGGVTPAAVTNPDLELRLYDPNAKSVPAYLKQPPTGSIARDWSGPSCIQLAGYNQSPPPQNVAAGASTDPPNLWTGVCQTAEDRCDHDPQLAALSWLTEVTGTKIGRWPLAEVPVKLSESPAYIGGRIDRGAPCYGEDNNYVYGELLGMSSQEIKALAEEGVI